MDGPAVELDSASGTRPQGREETEIIRRLQRLGARWTALMRRGRFEEAWRISDEALQTQTGIDCRRWPRHLQFIWNGTPLADRRVLVRCYHGLGDTIQYARFLRRLKRIAREVIVWVQPPLIPLLKSVAGIDRLLPLHDGVPEVDYDVDIELAELAHALRVSLASLAADVPYVHVDPAPRPAGTALSVGLVWRAGEWDPRRSIPAQRLASLAAVPGIDWQIFQRGPALAEWNLLGFGTVPPITDIVDEARRMRALDLLVTVDTCSAHLAGALGVPVWTLLHARPDWRWMDRRSDSPWYPTMRLFRQEHPDEWGPLIASVARELERLARSRR